MSHTYATAGIHHVVATVWALFSSGGKTTKTWPQTGATVGS
jgi:hypothetical protein